MRRTVPILLLALAGIAGDDPPRARPTPTHVEVLGPMQVRLTYAPPIDSRRGSGNASASVSVSDRPLAALNWRATSEYVFMATPLPI